MGRYIDWTHIVNRYPDAARIAGANDVGSSFIAGAEAEVDAALAARYTVPFTPAPPLVQSVVTDLAYCKMTIRQPESKPLQEQTQKLLDALVAGTLLLVDETGVVVQAGGPVRTFATNSYRSAFGPDDPLNWSPSQSADDDAQAVRDYD